MKLSHFDLKTPFEWTGENVCSFIIENPVCFRKIVGELIEQASVGIGSFVLSEQDKIIPFERNVEVISDIFNVDLLGKSIIGGIHKELTELCSHEMQSEMMSAFSQINRLMSDLCMNASTELTFDELNDISALLKAYHVRPDFEQLSLPEKLLLYMELSGKYNKKTLFIVVNLRAALSDSEAQCFYKDVVYHKFNLLDIEFCAGTKLEYEQRKILDSDMCEI